MDNFRSRLVPVSGKKERPAFADRLIPVSQPEEAKEPEESGLKSWIRSGLQIPQAFAELTLPGVIGSLMQLGAFGDEEFEAAEEAYDRFKAAGYPEEYLQKPDRAKYEEAKQAASRYAPTVSNIAQSVEEATGIPLTPKSDLDKIVRQTAGGAKLGGLQGAAIAGGGSQALQAAGLPESVADPASLLLAGIAPSVKPGSTAVKPSEIVQTNIKPKPAELEFKGPSNAIAGPKAPVKGPEVPPTQSPIQRTLQDVLKGIRAEEGPAAKAAGEAGLQGAKGALESELQLGEAPGGFQSEYEVGKAIKEALPRVQTAIHPNEILPSPLANPKQSPALTQRGTPAPQGTRLTIQPTAETPPQRTMTAEVQNIFSPTSFYNPTQAANGIKNEIMRLDEEAYSNVNDLYAQSRELNRDVTQVHPQLVDQIEDLIAPITQLPEPSTPQRSLIRAAESIINSLRRNVVRQGQPPIRVPVPVSNQILIDQVQSLRQQADYDFAHGGSKKNIFKPLIRLLNQAAIDAASTDPQALDALTNARQAYSDWATIFDNDYVIPWRDRSNRSFEKLYNTALQPDEYNVLRDVLSLSAPGRTMGETLQGEIANKRLEKFKKAPQNANPEELEQAIRSLEAVITPEQANEIRALFQRQIRQAQRPHAPITFRAEKRHRYKPETAKPHPLAEKDYEQLASMMNTLSGWDSLEKVIPNKELLQRIKDFKIADILQKGKISAPEETKSLVDVLNDRKTWALLNRLMGNERFNGLRKLVNEWAELETFLKELAEDQAKLAKLGLKKQEVTEAAKAMSEVIHWSLHPIKRSKLFVKRLFSAKNIDKMREVIKGNKKPVEDIKQSVNDVVAELRGLKE